jgi:hypothetical protein
MEPRHGETNARAARRKTVRKAGPVRGKLKSAHSLASGNPGPKLRGRQVCPLGPRFRGDERGCKSAAPRRQAASAKKDKGGRPPKYYTPEFLAEARRRVERTPESMTSIAGKFGMHHSVLSRLIKSQRWVRPEGSLRRRGLSPVMRLAAAADALVMASAGEAPHPDPLAAGGEKGRTESAAPAAQDLAAIDRLEQAVLRELATVETMRASLGKEPLRPMDAERTARTLSVLAETLSKLRRQRLAAAPQAGSDHDNDMPADIDAFRLDLARRIEAFLASRPDEGDAGADAARPVAEV